MVKVMYFGEMRRLAGKREEVFQARTVRDVLKAIGGEYGKQTRRAARRALITVDGERIRTVRDRLPEQCTVGFHPLCSGG